MLPEDLQNLTALFFKSCDENLGDLFPLTRGEREQQADASRSANGSNAITTLRLAEAGQTVLSLPKGEGRGEGKGDLNGSHVVRIVRDTLPSLHQHGFVPFIISNFQRSQKILAFSSTQLFIITFTTLSS
jgi:hypothetical protein